MKILSIRIQNLASLGGKTEINFSEEPLRSAGIFAITGPTGSGKSTILDALCLALYGKTPRYRLAENSIAVLDVNGSTINQGDVRGILRDGSSSGYAEVDFVGIDDQHYRATWSVRRARNKAEGNLQPNEVSLKNISTDQDIPGKKTELLPEIERLVGLNFEQFTRSVLLAQGDFTAFLKAGKDEKSSLLEKLTGTHIYSEISKKVFEHHREESQKLRDLDNQREGIATFTTEELQDLQEQKQQLGTSITAEEKQITALDKEVNWHEQRNKLQAGVKDAEQQNEKVVTAKLAAKSREDQFQQITLIQSARPILNELKGTQRQHTDKTKQAAELSNAKGTLTKLKKEADTVFMNVNKDLVVKEQEEELAKPLLTQANALDVKLDEQAKQVKQASKDLDDLRKREVNQSEQFTKAKAELVAVEEKIVTLKKWKEDNESRQPIAEQEHLILSKLSDAESILENLQMYNSRIKTTEEGISKDSKEKDHLTSQREAVQTQLNQSKVEYQSLDTALSKVSISDIEKEKTSLDVSIEDIVGASAHWKLLYSGILEKNRLQLEWDKNKKELEKNNLELDQADKLLTARSSERTASLKMLEKARLAAAESVDELRKQLEPGEPCVVCGSMDHPYASHNPGLAHVLSELEVEHARIEAAYTQQLTLHTTLSQKGTQLAKYIGDLEVQTIENNEKLESLDETWTEFKVSENCNAKPFQERTSWLQEQLKAQRIKQQQLVVEIQSYAKQKVQLENHKDQLARLDKEFDQIQNKIKDIDRTLKSLEDQTKSDIAEKQKVQKRLEELRQALTTYFTTEQWFENWRSNPVSFVSSIKEFANSWKVNIAELEAFLQKQKVQAEKIKGFEVQLNSTKDEVIISQKKLSDLEGVNKKLTENRKAIFNGAAVTEVEGKLKAAIQQAKQTLEQQRLKKEKLQEDLTKNVAQQGQLIEDIDSLSKQEGALKEELNDWIYKHNMQSEITLDQEKLLSLLEFNQDWIEAERKSLGAIEDAVKHAETVWKERTELLTVHLKQRLSERTQEELTTLRSQVKESLDRNNQKNNEVGFKINEDVKNKQRIGSLLEEINKQATIVENWAKLNEIIGSADGKKFRQIAQEYTLDVLLSYANVHLEVLSKRYILQRIPNSLGLQVLDQDMGDEVRTVYSLSGGESFLVSLALALGLASLSSSRMKVESLFIDEGFGSLDPATLNIAMDALERLHNQGRKVGVISHVQEMTERIPVQIKVSKQQSGKSKVEVIGF
ncbi:AAA family ATPase [Galbibacter sp.]|uniref:AAA family ATPase n=1 Tax=Galbibacter sp. TaxID=2918471 RepID=UPI003A8E5E1D